MNTLIPDAVRDDLLSEYTDKRLQTGITNIAKSCSKILKDGQDIDVKSVTDYIDKYYGGKPNKRTIEQDHKRIYRILIEEYAKLNKKKNVKKEQAIKAARVNNRTLADQIYIAHLEDRNGMLEKILKKQFKHSAGLDVDKAVSSHANTTDTVAVETKTPFTSVQIQVVNTLHDILLTQLDNRFIYNGEGKTKRILDTDTGEVILNPRHIHALNSIIKVEG